MEKIFDSWKFALGIIKKRAPKGLYERWKQLEPVGIIEWNDGVDYLERVNNSYNWIDDDNNNIIFQCGIIGQLVAVAFHFGMDVRGGYTDYFLFNVDYEDLPLFGFDNEEWEAMEKVKAR